MHRRQLLFAAATAPLAGVASGHGSMGPVQPEREPPLLRLRASDGRLAPLPALLASGAPAALQLMFTGCTSVCPIQGALFAALQASLDARQSQTTLLSLSVDPLGDTPAALMAWRARFGAGPRWIAASPRPEDLDTWLGWLEPDDPRGGDSHATRVHLLDSAGRLAWRSENFPTPSALLGLLRRLGG